MHPVEIRLNGETLLLDASGALYWPAEKALIFSDLHFEKASSYARRGTFLPPYDTRETIARMRAVIGRFLPSLVIALGDSFHDREAGDRLGDEEFDQLQALAVGRDWIWIVGNHDPEIPARLGGTIAEEVALGGLSFRHEPERSNAKGEVAGHFHPCATAVWRGRGLRRPCFVTDGERMIVPAFGSLTGGLDASEQPIASLFPRGFITYLLGARRVYAIGGTAGSHKLWRKNSDDSQPRNNATTTADAP
jgi:uncharacterized protein